MDSLIHGHEQKVSLFQRLRVKIGFIFRILIKEVVASVEVYTAETNI